MVFCSLIASSAIRAFISALKLRRCLDFISAPFPRQRFYTLLTGPNFGEHLKYQTPDQWEEMLREHLVAYLDGMKRVDLDENFANASPERRLLDGKFQGDGTYQFGTRMNFSIDL